MDRKNGKTEEQKRETTPRKKRKKMSYRKKVTYIQIGAITLAVFLLLILSAIGLTSLWKNHENQSQAAAAVKGEKKQEADDGKKEEEKEAEEGEQQVLQAEDTAEVKLTISAVGDCTIGTDEFFDKGSNFDAFYIVKKNPGYFFQNVKDIFAEDDLTIINMEGTLTESKDRQEKTYAFKGAPKYTEILNLANVDAANLANNHSHDYGEQSYTDTIENLEGAGITTFGYDRVAVVEREGIRIGLVGIYELADGIECQQQVIDNIHAVEDQGADLVIVSFHWGTEKETVPDDVQKSLAHIAIDNGADLVLGHHPHVLQGIEVYKGKNIVYSLGNFCFGGNRNPMDKDTMIFQQTFTFLDGIVQNDNTTNIIPCSLSSVPQYNDYQPIVLEGSEKDRVLEKIQNLSAGLSGSDE